MAVGSERVLLVLVVAWEPPIRSTVRAPLMPNRGRPTRDGEAKPAGPASPAYKQLLLGRELTLRLGASVPRPSRHIYSALAYQATAKYASYSPWLGICARPTAFGRSHGHVRSRAASRQAKAWEDWVEGRRG